ncbi:hypothetical protein WDU94_002929 [Cyamophila willieti]
MNTLLALLLLSSVATLNQVHGYHQDRQRSAIEAKKADGIVSGPRTYSKMNEGTNILHRKRRETEDKKHKHFELIKEILTNCTTIIKQFGNTIIEKGNDKIREFSDKVIDLQSAIKEKGRRGNVKIKRFRNKVLDFKDTIKEKGRIGNDKIKEFGNKVLDFGERTRLRMHKQIDWLIDQVERLRYCGREDLVTYLEGLVKKLDNEMVEGDLEQANVTTRRLSRFVRKIKNATTGNELRDKIVKFFNKIKEEDFCGEATTAPGNTTLHPALGPTGIPGKTCSRFSIAYSNECTQQDCQQTSFQRGNDGNIAAVAPGGERTDLVNEDVSKMHRTRRYITGPAQIDDDRDRNIASVTDEEHEQMNEDQDGSLIYRKRRFIASEADEESVPTNENKDSNLLDRKRRHVADAAGAGPPEMNGARSTQIRQDKYSRLQHRWRRYIAGTAKRRPAHMGNRIARALGDHSQMSKKMRILNRIRRPAQVNEDRGLLRRIRRFIVTDEDMVKHRQFMRGIRSKISKMKAQGINITKRVDDISDDICNYWFKYYENATKPNYSWVSDFNHPFTATPEYGKWPLWPEEYKLQDSDYPPHAMLEKEMKKNKTLYDKYFKHGGDLYDLKYGETTSRSPVS